MKHDIWFTSDTHFFHTNIIKFTDQEGRRIRPFSSLDEMHELMVERWNECVKPNDFVYHLGDVTFQYHDKFIALMKRLHGSKRLVFGNHDKCWNSALKVVFTKASLWRGFHEHNFTATHIPQRLDKIRDGEFNVHGHIHERLEPDPHYINVCVEVRGYRPVHIDQIVAEIKERQQCVSLCA